MPKTTADSLIATLPWVKFLSVEEVDEFTRDLTSALNAVEAITDHSPIDLVVESWRNTAEIHADPELDAILTASSVDDLGPLRVPEETDR